MKKDISNDQAYVFAIEILSDYDKLKSQPQPGIAHQKTNYFFGKREISSGYPE